MSAPGARFRRMVPFAALSAFLALVACDAPATLAGPQDPPVQTLEVLDGAGQAFFSGRRSPRAFGVRALDRSGGPVEGATVEWEIEGQAGGTLSQPRALTDAQGRAETFLLESTPGEGIVAARAGDARAEISFRVDRGPAEIRFLEGTGEVGLPGLPHPDSLIRVQVLDTEGDPLEGAEVWFAGPGQLAQPADTTDAQGLAETVLRRSGLTAGNQAFFAFILEFQELTVRTERPTAPAARRVILVSVDGLRADALERFQPPTLTRLAREGAWTTEAETVVPSLTVPAHLSLLSGVDPASHGVLNDAIQLTPEMASLEPLFRRVRASGRSAAAFLSSQGPLQGFEAALGCRLAFGLDSLALVQAGGLSVADTAAASLGPGGPDLVFLHLPDPDLAGHAWGWSSPQYEEAVLRADSALERIVEAASQGRDSTLVTVVSDHGGGGAYGDHLHGSSSPDDVRIPLVLWGSGVIPGTSLGRSSILDVAPTVLWALGIAPPSRYQGEILTGGFRQGPGDGTADSGRGR